MRAVNMTTYKVSYVITGSNHPGAIVNRHDRPTIGENIRLGPNTFEVIEVFDLVPPRGEFHYLHATCKKVNSDQNGEN